MNVLLSAAISLDGCLDDTSSRRLILSPAEDLAEIDRLRAASNAILVGARTLRCDNPSLRVRSAALVEERKAAGRAPQPLKVTVTTRGELPSDLRFFEGDRPPVVFAAAPLPPQLAQRAETICAPEITAALIVTELEKRGVENLLVEGGGEILSMFLRENMADRLRLATAPFIVGEAGAPRFLRPGRYPFDSGHRAVTESLRMAGDMSVATYRFHDDDPVRDRECLARAVELSRRCTPDPECYRVGAVVVTASGERYEGYTQMTARKNHAEEEAVAAALQAGADLRGATVYSSVEPCSARSSKPESCSRLLLRLGVRKVVFGLYEPDRFVHCTGALDLRRAGIRTLYLPEFARQILDINAHLFSRPRH